MTRAAALALGLGLALACTPSVAHAAPILIAWLAAYIGEVLATIVVYTVLSAVSALVSNALFGSKNKGNSANFGAESRDRKQIVRSAIASHRVVYGESVVSGPLLYAETTGEQNAVLHLVVALAGHECDAISDVWLGNRKVGTLSASGTVLDGDFSGATTTPQTDLFNVPGTLQYSLTYNSWRFVRMTTVRDLTAAADMVDVSPAAPGPGQFSHVEGVITFHSSALAHSISAGYVWTDPFVVVRKHLGDPNQLADTLLMDESGDLWTENHRLREICYLYVRMRVNPANNKFPNGIPNVKARVRGKKLYDPRDGVTRWTDNWALVVRDYLTGEHGLNASASEIDDASLIAAANICDERVTMAAHTQNFTADAAADAITLTAADFIFAGGDGVQVSSSGSLPGGLSAATTYYLIRSDDAVFKLASTYADALAGIAINLTNAGTGTHTLSHIDQPRYTLNGTVDLGVKPSDIVDALRTAACGAVVYTQGVYKVYPAAYAAPTVTLTAADLRDTISVRAKIPRKDLFNQVRGTFVDPARGWEATDFPAVTNATYVAQDDNEEIPRDLELPYTTNTVRAQRLAKIALEKSRQGMVVTFPAKLTAFRLPVYDTVALTIDGFGWSSKVFRVLAWEFVPDGTGGVDLTLQEEAAASYAWNAGEATVVDPAPDTNFPDPFNVLAPGVPAITEEIYETSGSAGVKSRAAAAWASTDALTVSYQFEYKLAADSTYTILPLTAGLSIVLEDLAPGVYDFRVKGINTLGASSPYAERNAFDILGLTAPPADVSGFTVVKSAGFALAQWSPHQDLDVQINGAVVIRHNPDTAGVVWSDSIVVGTFPGAQVQGFVALATGTYMAKALDSSGNYSTNAVSFVVTEGMVSGYNLDFTVSEHPAFSGAKSNVAKVGASIQLDSATLLDSMTDLIDTWPFLDSIGGVSGTGTYDFLTYVDRTTVATRRLEADIRVSGFDTGDLIDARTTLIDDWGLFDGSVVDDCNAQLYVSTTDTDPAGSPVWSSYVPMPLAADVTARAYRFQLQLVSGSPTHNISCDLLKVDGKTPVSP